MKIGILTQPLQNNYGGLLQNYALQQVLISMGHQVETLDHGYKRVSFVHKYLSFLKQYLLHLVWPSKYRLPSYHPTTEESSIIRKNTLYFVNKYIPHTNTFHSKDDFTRAAIKNNYDAYIVGSDQCWRYLYNGAFFEEMFLSFVESNSLVKKIAYAVSFGTDVWELDPVMTNRCASLAKKFECISVREDSGITLCKDHLGVDAKHVLDPTMLLPKEAYISLIKNENEPCKTGDLFYYILDPDPSKKSLIDEICQVGGYTSFTVLPKCLAEQRTKSDIRSRINDCVYPTVTSWLRGFYDSKLVVVDSFHGMVFSIIFNKPFWVIGNETRGNARFRSALKMFKLEDRMISVPLQKHIDWDTPINWEIVNEIKRGYQQISMDFLQNGLD